MVRDGILTPSAFPMDELLAKQGKSGASVDRCKLLPNPDTLLREKSQGISNPAGGRNPYGFSVAEAYNIRAIVVDTTSAQALDIWPDEIRYNDPPKPWDDAHALIRKFDKEYTRAHLRGTRDHLTAIFSESITLFAE